MRKPGVILQVAINTPLNQLFDYRAPDGDTAAQPGQRVRVPFGKREQVGIVVAVTDSTDIPADRLRAATEILDPAPLLDRELLQLLQWSAGYYQQAPGEAFAAALPALLRRGDPAIPAQRSLWSATPAGHAVNLDELAVRAPVQARLLAALRSADQLDAAVLGSLHDSWRRILATLAEKSWVHAITVALEVTDATTAVLDQPPQLSAAQVNALAKIPATGFNACLLEGVTGSGKTEVYLQLIAAQLAEGRQSLVLVPEIGLTPQLVERFRRRLPGRIVVMHSGLTDSERLAAWLAARDGSASVVIGTRSAIFTPLAQPGLIVVDEEHDSSYKQQDGFRYSARDLAVYRARQLGIPVVLGSATPAFESLHNALEQRYLHLCLPERAGNASPPEVRIVDLRHYALRDGLSQPLLDGMRRHLHAGGQCLVYLNRRGFAPTLLCPTCGKTEECKRCDARMVLHQKRQRLVCHHCGSERPAPALCPDCQTEFVPLGQGTERLEESLAKLFPDYPLARIDRDTTRRSGELERLLDTVHSEQSRILLGTQMLTKGHHFPGVTMVAIIDSDQGLFGTDFRSSERLAQAIVQVAGRAGRAERAGEVWIQTFYPDHPLLQTLLTEGYSNFARKALAERHAAGWPPFCHLVLLRGECAERDRLFRFLDAARACAPDSGPQIRILGPATAPMERRSGRYRGQLLVQSGQRIELQRFLPEWRNRLGKLADARRVRWSLDVDPIELF